MAKGCCASLAKTFLIIFNLIFLICGAVLLGVGIWLSVDSSIVSYVKILEALENGSLLKFAGYAFIAVGLGIFIIGIFGCCGAARENNCMLGVYMMLLVIVMAIEVAGGVLGLLVKNRLVEDLELELTDALTEHYGKTAEKKSEAFTEGMDFIQENLECCGIINANTEYPTTQYWEDNKSLPTSCCKDIPDNQGKCPTYYTDSCKDSIINFVDEKAPIIIGVGIGLAAIQIFGFIFAVCLCRDIGLQSYKEVS